MFAIEILYICVLSLVWLEIIPNKTAAQKHDVEMKPLR